MSEATDLRNAIAKLKARREAAYCELQKLDCELAAMYLRQMEANILRHRKLLVAAGAVVVL